MEKNHPISDLMSVTMQKIRDMVDVNTIVGTPITTPDGTTIIPVSKVSFGFASGGSDFGAKSGSTELMFGGGSGAGVTISPVSFLVVCNGMVKMLPVEAKSTGPVEKIIDMMPDMVDKVNSLVEKHMKKKDAAAEDCECICDTLEDE